MHIFCHRGICDKYPENSLVALRSALDSGFSVEIDLRLTADKDFVIIHDDNLKRLCNENAAVASFSLSQLLKKSFSSSPGHNLTSFHRYLEILGKSNPKLLTAIHLKSDSQTSTGLRSISKYVSEFNLYDRVFVFDLNTSAAELLRQVDPKIKIAFTISEYKFEPTIYLWDEVKSLDFDIVWAAEYRKLYSKEFINAVKKTGRRFYAMSPDVHKAPHILHPRAYKNYELTWRDLVKWNTDGICTDLPHKLKKMLRY